MISITTKGYLFQNRSLRVMLPEELQLTEGEYEIVLVLQSVKPKFRQQEERKLRFASHKYCLPENTTFGRNDLYNEYGR